MDCIKVINGLAGTHLDEYICFRSLQGIKDCMKKGLYSQNITSKLQFRTNECLLGDFLGNNTFLYNLLPSQASSRWLLTEGGNSG